MNKVQKKGTDQQKGTKKQKKRHMSTDVRATAS